MARQLTAGSARNAILGMHSAPEAMDETAQHKLSRLLELRAVIEAMRAEPEADPLLAWVIAQDQGNHP